MFIAAIIGATIVILTVFYAVILFIACIIDQHKWEHDKDYDGRQYMSVRPIEKEDKDDTERGV